MSVSPRSSGARSQAIKSPMIAVGTAEIAATQIVVKKLFHAAPDQIRPNSLDQPIEKARA